jgi:hypothetical protein
MPTVKGFRISPHCGIDAGRALGCDNFQISFVELAQLPIGVYDDWTAAITEGISAKLKNH